MEPVAVFKQIHRISRVMLYETAINLQMTDFRSHSGMECLASKINTIILLMEDYTVRQEECVFTALAEYEPSIVDAFRQKHNTLRGQMTTLASAVQEAAIARELRSRVEAGRRLETLFTQFLRFQLKLMAEKEAILHPVLWRYYAKDHLHDLQQELM